MAKKGAYRIEADASGELPLKGKGVEKASFPLIDAKARELDDLRENRKKLNEDISSCELAVAKLMKEHDLASYEFKNYRVLLTEGPNKVTVKRKSRYKPAPQDESK